MVDLRGLFLHHLPPSSDCLHALCLSFYQVHGFARAWATWIAANGGIASVTSHAYLDKAEPFVKEFIKSGGAMIDVGGAVARPENAFQVCVCAQPWSFMVMRNIISHSSPRAQAEA